MREDFIILSVVGWCWAALVGLFLLIRLRLVSKADCKARDIDPSDTSHLG